MFQSFLGQQNFRMVATGFKMTNKMDYFCGIFTWSYKPRLSDGGFFYPAETQFLAIRPSENSRNSHSVPKKSRILARPPSRNTIFGRPPPPRPKLNFSPRAAETEFLDVTSQCKPRIKTIGLKKRKACGCCQLLFILLARVAGDDDEADTPIILCIG